MTVIEQNAAHALVALPGKLDRLGHDLAIVARQQKLLEKSLNVLCAIEYARLSRETGEADPKQVLGRFDDLVLAIRETKGASGLKLQDDGCYGEDK